MRSTSETHCIRDSFDISSSATVYGCRTWSKSYQYAVLHLAVEAETAPTNDDVTFTVQTTAATPVVLGTIALGAASGISDGDQFELFLADKDIPVDAGTTVHVKCTSATGTDATFVGHAELIVTIRHN